MRFSLGGLATPTEVSWWLSQHFPCSLATGRDSNVLMLKGRRPGPHVLDSFPGTRQLLLFLSFSTHRGATGGEPPPTDAPAPGPRKAHGTAGMGPGWMGAVSLLSLPLAGTVTQHSREGQMQTRDQTPPGSAARRLGPTSDSDSSWDAALR